MISAVLGTAVDRCGTCMTLQARRKKVRPKEAEDLELFLELFASRPVRVAAVPFVVGMLVVALVTKKFQN